MSKGSKGGGSTTSTVTNTTQLTAEQKQLLAQAMPWAKRYAANAPKLYPNSTVAGFTPLQQQANQGFLDAAGQSGSLANATMGANMFGLGPVLYTDSNPALQAATSAAIRPLIQEYEQTLMPGIKNNAVQAGQFGSSRQGVAEGIAGQALLQQIGDTSAKLQSTAYGQGLDTFQRSMLLAPQTAQLSTYPSQLLDTVGTRQQSMNQQLLDEKIARYQYGQMLPYYMAKDLADLAFGVGPTGSTSTATGPGAQQPSGLMSALSGASTGASLFSTLGFNPIIGGAVGGLASLFFGN